MDTDGCRRTESELGWGRAELECGAATPGRCDPESANAARPGATRRDAADVPEPGLACTTVAGFGPGAERGPAPGLHERRPGRPGPRLASAAPRHSAADRAQGQARFGARGPDTAIYGDGHASKVMKWRSKPRCLRATTRSPRAKGRRSRDRRLACSRALARVGKTTC